MADAKEKGVTPDDYLASVHKELLDFYERREDGSQEVWDREQLLEALRSALATTGQSDCHAMLLAGKSCGKSTVLKSVAGVTNDGAIASMAASACTRPGWSQRHR